MIVKVNSSKIAGLVSLGIHYHRRIWHNFSEFSTFVRLSLSIYIFFCDTDELYMLYVDEKLVWRTELYISLVNFYLHVLVDVFARGYIYICRRNVCLIFQVINLVSFLWVTTKKEKEDDIIPPFQINVHTLYNN